MRRWLLSLLCAGGCASVFRIDEVIPPDAAPDSFVVPCPEGIGHDEDGDKIDDACDPCPFNSDNDGDIDADGIADACDPDTTIPNSRLLFDGFGTLSGSYLITGGGIANDAFELTAVPGGSASGALLWTGGGGIDPVWITAGVDVSNVELLETFREAGLVFDGTPVPGTQVNGTYCVLGMEPVSMGGDQYVQLFARDRPNGDDPILTRAATLQLPDLRDGLARGSSTRTAPVVAACSFAVGGTASTIASAPNPLPTAGLPGIYLANVNATFRFLFITGRR